MVSLDIEEHSAHLAASQDDVNIHFNQTVIFVLFPCGSHNWGQCPLFAPFATFSVQLPYYLSGLQFTTACQKEISL